MARAYIVEGNTGEHSDHRTWPVAVFTSRGRAVRFAAKANQWLKDQGLHQDEGYIPNYYERHAEARECLFDPQIQLDYNGTAYDVFPTALDPELPR